MSTDPVIQAALDRLHELAEERRELEAFLETHRRLAAKLVGSTHVTARTAVDLRDGGRASTTAEILDAVEGVLRKSKGPMQLAQIHAELTERGIVIPGKDPRNNLSAKLYASKRFATTRGVGWSLADLGTTDAQPLDGERT